MRCHSSGCLHSAAMLNPCKLVFTCVSNYSTLKPPEVPGCGKTQSAFEIVIPTRPQPRLRGEDGEESASSTFPQPANSRLMICAIEDYRHLSATALRGLRAD